jgi:hypothetical protein
LPCYLGHSRRYSKELLLNIFVLLLVKMSGKDRKICSYIRKALRSDFCALRIHCLSITAIEDYALSHVADTQVAVTEVIK